MPRFFPLLQSCVLAAFLAGPAVLPFLGLPSGRLAVEKRPLAAFPPLSLAWSDPAGYGPALAGAVRDGLPFRDHLIRANSRLRLALFRESPVPGVLVGRHGWLFYTNEWALDDFLNVLPLSEKDLAAMVRIQVERRDWLAARGIGYLVVFAPNKASVYPEEMPEGMAPLSPASRLDRLVPRLREAGVAVVDLRGALAEAKATRRAYQKTDTHWNGWGAFRGAAAILGAVSALRPGLPALAASEYEVREEDGPGGDLAEMLLLPDVWREIDWVPHKKTPVLARPAPDGPYPDPADHPERERRAYETDRTDWPRLLFFHDSFARPMAGFLAERSSRSVFLWSHAFSPAIIEAEKPDVVILETVERYVYALSLENPEPVRRPGGPAVGNAPCGGDGGSGDGTR
uniref:AlgX/AlgJ SGNH hydrolase-like domain-containing protein n=1 Tax=Desulfovibrio sp. U5L TaxID=596152 RepID=I2Q696_9BACT